MDNRTKHNIKELTQNSLNDIKSGDQEHFSRLFTENYGNLLSYACRLLCDESEAEECVHSTFCHLWDIRGRVEIRDSVRSYLFRSVYNRAVSTLRQRKIISRYEEKGLADLYFTRVIQSPQAELRLITSETRKIIENAIDSLPGRCREIFIRCKINGQTYSQVATSLEISEKTVENQMTIALKKLREKLRWLLLMFF